MANSRFSQHPAAIAKATIISKSNIFSFPIMIVIALNSRWKDLQDGMRRIPFHRPPMKLLICQLDSLLDQQQKRLLDPF